MNTKLRKFCLEVIKLFQQLVLRLSPELVRLQLPLCGKGGQALFQTLLNITSSSLQFRGSYWISRSLYSPSFYTAVHVAVKGVHVLYDIANLVPRLCVDDLGTSLALRRG